MIKRKIKTHDNLIFLIKGSYFYLFIFLFIFFLGGGDFLNKDETSFINVDLSLLSVHFFGSCEGTELRG